MTIRASAVSFSNEIYLAHEGLAKSRHDEREEIFAHVRPLRAYAILLVGDRAQADDLAEETLRKAWADFASFQRGGDLRVWLFTILCGAFSARSREVPPGAAKDQGAVSARRPLHPSVDPQDLAEFRRAFAALPDAEREALLLVAAEGFSHKAAATICACAVSTIDRRALRGKHRLAQSLA